MVLFLSTVKVPLISSIVSLQWMFLSCRSRFAAIRTPPCGSCGLSLCWMSKPRSFGSISLEAIHLSNQVSVWDRVNDNRLCFHPRMRNPALCVCTG